MPREPGIRLRYARTVLTQYSPGRTENTIKRRNRFAEQAFIRLQFQSATESDHITKIANLSGLGIRIFDLLEHSIPNLGQLGFDSGRINLNGFTERFADEIELLGERLHRGSF